MMYTSVYQLGDEIHMFANEVFHGIIHNILINRSFKFY